MFNGIILNQGIVKKITNRRKGIDIFIKPSLKIEKTCITDCFNAVIHESIPLSKSQI